MAGSVAVAMVLVVAAAPAIALEKQLMRAPNLDGEDWDASTTITIRYYNYCTGWVWAWGPFLPGETFGVQFDAGPDGGLLDETRLLIWFAPGRFCGGYGGYGFTGTISILDPPDCNGTPIAELPFCVNRPWAALTWGWWATEWGGIPVPQSFLLNVNWGGEYYSNPHLWASDLGAAGPTGPQACGLCYPADRTVHSRYFGIGGEYCPSGVTLNDGVCDLELVVQASLRTPVGLQDESWGGIKALYR
jgi:hypothetical protein